MTQTITKYFKGGKECPPDEADEVIVSELDDAGKLTDEKRYYKKNKCRECGRELKDNTRKICHSCEDMLDEEQQ